MGLYLGERNGVPWDQATGRYDRQHLSFLQKQEGSEPGGSVGMRTRYQGRHSAFCCLVTSCLVFSNWFESFPWLSHRSAYVATARGHSDLPSPFPPQCIVSVAGGATRAALTMHQARRNNMADVSAKDSSQVSSRNWGWGELEQGGRLGSDLGVGREAPEFCLVLHSVLLLNCFAPFLNRKFFSFKINSFQRY